MQKVWIDLDMLEETSWSPTGIEMKKFINKKSGLNNLIFLCIHPKLKGLEFEVDPWKYKTKFWKVKRIKK